MERHVDTGHQNVGPLASGDLPAALDLGLQCLQTPHRARDRVLRATQVEVDDLQEFPGALGDLGDKPGDVGVVDVDLRRPDGGQSVIRAPLLIARHDVVHLAATVKHHLDQRFQLEDPGDAGDRGVFAHRVPAGNGAFDEGALLAHLGHLGGRHRGHGDLGELSQVQHALGVLVVHAGGNQAGGIVADHVQHRKAQRLPGECVGAIPHLARRLGSGPDLHAHALVLDTLAGEGIRRLRRGQPSGRRHHQLALDFGSYL